MMVDHRLSWLVLVALYTTAHSQTVPSPCPSVFKYELPGSEAGRWYGVITLNTDITLHGLWLNVVLDSKADILGNWVGEVTTTDNMDFKIENTTLKFQPGPALSVRFFIQYNQLGKVPRLTAIRLNGREICNANDPAPAVGRPLYPTNVVQTESRPVRPAVEEKPVRDGEERERPVYISTENPPSGQGIAKPYSIIGGGNNQDLGSQTDKRPGLVSSGTQTRPVDQNRPTFDQSNSGVDQGGQTYDQTRPNVDQSRPTYEQSRPNYDQPRSTTARTRPTHTRPVQSSSGNTHYQDYTDDNSAPADADYFSGGLPSLTAVLSSNRPSRPTSNQQNQCGKVVRNATPLIVNGRPTLEGQWPWQIALYQTQTVDSKYICGGTLVSRNYVVTAAHCVTRKGSPQLVNKNTFTIYLGKHNLRTSIEGVQIKFVAEITIHPSYNSSSYSRDVGVLRLRDPAEITDYVRPACLWPEDQADLSYVIGKRGSVVGWGFDDKGLATEELTLVEMPVVEQEVCIRSYSEFFARFTSEYTYCAGYRDGTSVCNGDSGGGMVLKMGDKWYLRGLVSLSVARQNEYRCDPTHYVVFTDLAKFLPWLRQVMSNDF